MSWKFQLKSSANLKILEIRLFDKLDENGTFWFDLRYPSKFSKVSRRQWINYTIYKHCLGDVGGMESLEVYELDLFTNLNKMAITKFLTLLRKREHTKKSRNRRGLVPRISLPHTLKVSTSNHQLFLRYGWYSFFAHSKDRICFDYVWNFLIVSS
jgi:hypothetical protein